MEKEQAVEQERYFEKNLEQADMRGMEGKAESMFQQQDQLEILRHYSESDQTIPLITRKSNWAIFNKNMSLTFLKESDLMLVDLQSNLLRIARMMTEPTHKLTFDKINEFDQIDLFFWLQAKRAIGSTATVMNERTLQATQILQRASSSQMNMPQGRGGIKGFLDKFL